jgi:hypothetical protein
MDFKSFKVDLDEDFKALSKGEGSARIAQFNVIDSDGDVTLPGAFGEQHVNMLPAHDRMAPRLGKAILKEVGNFAVADFKFNLAPEAVTAKEWHSSLVFDQKNGQPLQEWSYGFRIVDSSFGEFENQQVRFLKGLKVHEISPVLRGAGVGTETLAIKSKNMSFVQQMELASASLDDVKAFIERNRSLADLKAKAGNSLSDDKIETLGLFKTSLVEALSNCEELIANIGEESKSVDAVLEAFAKYQHTLFKAKNL